MHDYVRITGSCPLSVADATEADVMACASLCATAAADPARCIALNYSPWYARFPGTDPTVTGATETAELTFYAGHLANITTWLRRGRCLPGLTQAARDHEGGPACGAAKVGVAAFLLDSEKVRAISLLVTSYGKVVDSVNAILDSVLS